jgi:hypothetical protein
MKQIKVKVEGTAPLYISRYVISDKKGKSVYVPEEESESVTYKNDKGIYFIPSRCFKACMVAAGSDYKMKGHKTYKKYLKSGLFILEEECIITPQKYEISTSPVNQQGKMVVKSRPKWKNWKTEFTIQIANEEFLDQTTIKQILETAGTYQGVGTWRPENGRFKVTEWKVL